MHSRTKEPTGNAFTCPVLKTNAIILTIIDLFNGRSTVEDPFRLAGDGLREVTKTVPLTTLFFVAVNTPGKYRAESLTYAGSWNRCRQMPHRPKEAQSDGDMAGD